MKKIFKKIIVWILVFESKLVLLKYRPKIIAITGSVGKTTTKDAIFAVLSTSYFVRKSAKSFNSDIGVPLTILGLPNAWSNPYEWLKNIVEGLFVFLFPHKYPEWLVVEVGADRPGDIKAVAKWLCPNVAVVTKMSDVPVHIEFFKSVDEVRAEKAELVRATNEKSIVVLNADDERVATMRDLTKGRVVTFGISDSSDVKGGEFGFLYDQNGFPEGIKFSVASGEQKEQIEIFGSLGRQQMYTALAAIAVANSVGVSLDKVKTVLSKYGSSPGRMKIIAGKNGSCLIDDSYNSSPVAVAEAIETLSNLEVTGRRIPVLGDMLELGQYSKAEHEKVGKRVATVADMLFTVGTRAVDIATSARMAGLSPEGVFSFDDSLQAGEAISSLIQPGDVVLVKGSQGVRMEKVVAKLMRDENLAGELLVRQERAWQNR